MVRLVREREVDVLAVQELTPRFAAELIVSGYADAAARAGRG